jgi:hypothetical protein
LNGYMCSSPNCADPTATEVGTLDRNRKGNVAEAAVVFHAARLGIQVFRPLLEHGRYDLVLDVGGRLQRVQCKWAQQMGEVVVVRLASNRLTPAGYVRTHYTKDQIDAVAAYCADLDRCYLLPVHLVAGRNQVSLRLEATRNGQEAKVNWAAHFELAAMVKGAPGDGHLNVETARVIAPPPHSVPDHGMVVTAHEFRGRFGRFMELASMGAEINVTRFGRPFVRLVPAEQHGLPKELFG